jgi:hypothetical protein
VSALLLQPLLLRRSCCARYQPLQLLLLLLVLMLWAPQQQQIAQLRCAPHQPACLQCWVMASAACSTPQMTAMSQCSACAAAADVHPAGHLTPHLLLLLQQQLLLCQHAAEAPHLS